MSNISSIRPGGSLPDPRMPGNLPDPELMQEPLPGREPLPVREPLPGRDLPPVLPGEGRGLFGHVGDVFVGGGQAIGDMISGIFTAITHPIQTLKGIGHVLTHPGELVSAMVNPYKKAMSEGRPGLAIGRGIVEIGSLFIGPSQIGGAAKGILGGGKTAARVGKGAELAGKGAELSSRLTTQAMAAVEKAGALKLVGAMGEAAKLEQFARILQKSAHLAASGTEKGVTRAVRYATMAANAQRVAVVGANGTRTMMSMTRLVEHSNSLLLKAAGVSSGTATRAAGETARSVRGLSAAYDLPVKLTNGARDVFKALDFPLSEGQKVLDVADEVFKQARGSGMSSKVALAEARTFIAERLGLQATDEAVSTLANTLRPSTKSLLSNPATVSGQFRRTNYVTRPLREAAEAIGRPVDRAIGEVGSGIGNAIRNIGDLKIREIPAAIGEVATYPFRVAGQAASEAGRVIREGARNIGQGVRHIGDMPIRRAWEIPAEAVRRSIQGAGEVLGRLPNMTIGEVVSLPFQGGLLRPALALGALGRLEGVRDLPASDDLAADRYGILQTPENLEAFRKEVNSYAENAIGPDAGSPEDVKELQGLLRQLGYDVEPSGTFDEATSLAVIDFKQKNGITQSYKLASGKPAINEYVDEQTAKAMLEAARDKAGPAADPANLPRVTAADVNNRLDALEKALDAAGKASTPEEKAKAREALDAEAEATLIALSAFAAANPESRENIQAQMEDIGKALGEAGYTDKELADLVLRSKARLDEQIARKANPGESPGEESDEEDANSRTSSPVRPETPGAPATPERPAQKPAPASGNVSGAEVNATLDALEKALTTHQEAAAPEAKAAARTALETAAANAVTTLTRYGLAHPDATRDVEEQLSEIARSLSEQGLADAQVQALVKKAQAAGADTPSPRPVSSIDRGLSGLVEGILALREAKTPEAQQASRQTLLETYTTLVDEARSALRDLEGPQAEALENKLAEAGKTLVQAGLSQADIDRVLTGSRADSASRTVPPATPVAPASPASSSDPAAPTTPATPARTATPETSPAPAAPATPVSPTRPAASTGARTHTVGRDESLTRIAQRELGDANRWREIYELNRGVIGADPNRLFPGTKLQLPGTGSAVPANPATPTSTPRPAAPAASEPARAEGELGSVLRERGLLDTAENARIFMTEIDGYRQQNAIGPDSTDRETLLQLQNLLAKAGHPVASSGTFDEATAEAILAFKLKSGLHQQYRNADGSFAVNEYVDEATARALVEAATKAGQTPSASEPETRD
jgi:nucleoid-associated protein YgaU